MKTALTEAGRALAKARFESQAPARRSEAGRIGATARWNKEKQMVTAVRTRLSTTQEQQGGAGPYFKRRVWYALSPDNVRTLLRAALAEGNTSITSDDLVAHSMGRLREEALRAVIDEDTLKRTLVRADPDPVGDRLAEEHQTQSGEEVRVIRKAFGVVPGLGMTTRERTLAYRVPSKAKLREALMKAVRTGEIEAGALAALDAGRLPEGTLLKAFPTAQRTDGHMDLLKAAAELDELVERNAMSDEERYARRMR